MARESLTLLLDRIAGEEQESHRTVAPTLVERRSVAPPGRR